jgi:type IV pilus assembly protein PilM
MLGLNEKQIGIDIADNTIEVAQIAGSKVLSLSRIKVSDGVVEHDRIKDEEKLILAINKLFNGAKPKKIKTKEIIFKLQESQSFVFTIQVDKGRKVEEVVEEEIENSIPLEKDDLIYNYRVVGKNKRGKEVLIVAASKEVLIMWQKFFEKLKIKIKYFDIEALANYRALSFKSDKEPVCIVDIGSKTTNIALFNKNNLYYSYAMQKAGQFLSQQIANALKIDLVKAEEKKIKVDLKNKGKIGKIIIEGLQPMINEIRSGITYLESKSKQKVKKVILIGGSAQLKGLVGYLSDNLKVEVKIGSPVLRDSNVKLIYLGAIGVAMGIDKQNKKLIFETKKIKKNDMPTKKQIEKPVVKSKKQDLESIGGLEPLEEKSGSGNKGKIIIFFVVMLIGIILVVGAFWYRNNQRAQTREAQEKAQSIEIPDVSEKLKELVEEQSVIESKEYVVIKDTPTGFLNVRSGPDTSYDVITKVNPGTEYVVLDEDEEWFQIEVTDDMNGWIYSIYAEKI